MPTWHYSIEQNTGFDLKREGGTNRSYRAGIFYHQNPTIRLGLRHTSCDFDDDVIPSIATQLGAFKL